MHGLLQHYILDIIHIKRNSGHNFRFSKTNIIGHNLNIYIYNHLFPIVSCTDWSSSMLALRFNSICFALGLMRGSLLRGENH